MKSVLVTGATGWIGRHTLEPLVAAGFEVHGVHHRTEPLDVGGVRWHRADLLREDLPVETSHLLHLAWFAAPGAFWDAPENRAWLEASRRLMSRFGGERIVAAGTCAEYDWSAGVCLEHKTPLAPRGLYGRCKNDLRRFLERLPVSSAWGRVFFLFGPHEPREKLVAATVLALLDGRQADLSDGRQRRDYLHVADVGTAFARLVASTVEGPVNIGSGVAVAVRTLAELAARESGRPDFLRFGPPAPEPPLVVADTRRLRDEVRWSPRFDVASGIADTVRWWRANR